MKIMKTKTKVQLGAAVGAGYLLGRTHQLKLAVKLARTGGRSPSGPQDLLTQGSELLASSPDIAELGDSVRDELLDVTAAKAEAEATSEHIASFRDRLRSRRANVVSGGGHLVAGVKRIGHRGHAHPAESTVDAEPDNGKVENEKQQQPSSGRARLRRITPHAFHHA